MSSVDRPITLVTRGSALALTQTRTILAQCRAAFPDVQFEMKIVKTTGDKLQRSAPEDGTPPPEKGLFTKELEVELLQGSSDLAIHSLKDLPTDLPQGLMLGAVSKRVDVRDVLIYRDVNSSAGASLESEGKGRAFSPHASPSDFPNGALIATGSTRRQAQLAAIRNDLKFALIRGNVGTRLEKLTAQSQLDAIVLAAAGLNRLHFQIRSDGTLVYDQDLDPSKDSAEKLHSLTKGLLASYLPIDEMLPCVGQAAIGIEIRTNDERSSAICDRLNDPQTLQCVSAERAFLAAMGGGCLSPIGAYAEIVNDRLLLKAVSFVDGSKRKGQTEGDIQQGLDLACALAKELGGSSNSGET